MRIIKPKYNPYHNFINSLHSCFHALKIFQGNHHLHFHFHLHQVQEMVKQSCKKENLLPSDFQNQASIWFLEPSSYWNWDFVAVWILEPRIGNHVQIFPGQWPLSKPFQATKGAALSHGLREGGSSGDRSNVFFFSARCKVTEKVFFGKGVVEWIKLRGESWVNKS